MLRSGLLAEAGLGEAGWHWGRHNTTHSHNLLIRTVITVSMLRIMASWSTGWDSAAVTAARLRTDCIVLHHTVHCRQQTHTCYITSCRQIITLQSCDPGETGRGHGWLVTDRMPIPSSEERAATSWPMERAADQPQPLPALYQWSAPRRLCTQYLLETA